MHRRPSPRAPHCRLGYGCATTPTTLRSPAPSLPLDCLRLAAACNTQSCDLAGSPSRLFAPLCFLPVHTVFAPAAVHSKGSPFAPSACFRAELARIAFEVAECPVRDRVSVRCSVRCSAGGARCCFCCCLASNQTDRRSMKRRERKCIERRLAVSVGRNCGLRTCLPLTFCHKFI